MKIVSLTLLLITLGLSRAWAGDAPPTILTNKEAIDLVQSHANYMWTLVAAALVFFMQAGFAMVEAGFTRAKNAVNIMMKNLMDFSMGSLAYWAIGFGLMFGVSNLPFPFCGKNNFIGLDIPVPQPDIPCSDGFFQTGCYFA